MFVTKLDVSHASDLQKLLSDHNFEFNSVPYSLVSGKKKGISCTLYESGKLVVQGKEAQQFIEFYLEPQILKEFNFTYKELTVDQTPHIGIDEAGKGDVFGPLCIAGVYAEGAGSLKLLDMGVKDSKHLSDQKVLLLSQKIRENYPHHVIILFPRKYNELYPKFPNLNHMLGWGHASVAEQLIQKTGCNNVTIDQFASEYVVENALKRKKMQVQLTQRHRAEEDIVVAAASILARAAFLEGLKQLGDRLGYPLPKGAASITIDFGKKAVEQYGPAILTDIAKTHFKTVKQILGLPVEQ
ncbi:MAG: ribonuclease [Chlamydiales bacterium]|jgi:ribonuclease HIII|nr:ribonuclease [Chlamydiales bacterium]